MLINFPKGKQSEIRPDPLSQGFGQLGGLGERAGFREGGQKKRAVGSGEGWGKGELRGHHGEKREPLSCDLEPWGRGKLFKEDFRKLSMDAKTTALPL